MNSLRLSSAVRGVVSRSKTLTRVFGILCVLAAAPSHAVSITDKDDWYPTSQVAYDTCIADFNVRPGFLDNVCGHGVTLGGSCNSPTAGRYHYSYWCNQGPPPHPNICARLYRYCGDNSCPVGYIFDSVAGKCVATPPPAPNKNGGPPNCGAGNPCDIATGAKFQTEVDVAASANDPGITRYYSTENTRNLRFGYGWTSPIYGKRLYFFTGNVVHLTHDNGKTEAFICGGGPCTGDADTTYTLTQDTTGYTLAEPNGGTERFDIYGRVLTRTDSAGNVTTYFYDSGSQTRIKGPFGHQYTLLSNATGNLGQITLPNGQGINYYYDAKYNLVKALYNNNTWTHYHYENASFPHHLTGVSYEGSNRVITRYSTFTYDATGKAIATEHAGPTQRFTLAFNGNQTTVTDAANTASVYTFGQNLGVKHLTNKLNQADGKTLDQIIDSNNNPVCEKNEEGRVTTHAYNVYNQKISTTEGLTGTCAAPMSNPATKTTTYTYVSNAIDLVSTITSPSAATGLTKTTTIAYNNSAFPNLPTTITQAGYTPTSSSVSRSVSLTYNSKGQVATIDGPRSDVNDITTLAYNLCTTGSGCGQVSSITNALGHTTTFNTYNGLGRVTQSTDANGLVTAYLYDTRAQVTRITQTPLGGTARVTNYTYTASGKVATVTFPDGTRLTYTYNAAFLLTKVADLVGNYVAYTYDVKGNKISEKTYSPTNVLVRQIDLAYDLRNHLAQINAAGSITQQIHDALGNLTQTTDPKTNPSQNSFDALNRITQTLNALGGTTSYSYDANDKLKQIVAPNNATTQYSYDDLGNLLSEVSPDRGTTTYTYDAAGNLTSKTDARGITATYTYDALNRPTTVNYPGTAEDVAHTYDSGAACTLGIGRLCQVTDGSGITTYAFDAFGNVTQQKKTELGFIYTTSYTYDAGNRLNSVTYPDGRVITYTRNTLRKITGVTATVNGTAQTIVSSRVYKADGLLANQTYGNALAETRTYDLQGRLTNQNLGTAGTRLYGYDSNGNVTSLQNPSHTGSYTYDALDRLIQDAITSSPSSTVPFMYDPNGNRTSDGTNTNTYAAATNKLMQTGSSVITTDAAGNITSDGTRTFTYNNDGHLSTVSTGGTYTYNAQRQRTRKVVGSVTTLYHYDLSGNLILETNATSNTQVAYVNADAAPIGQINRNAGTDTVTYLHTDHEGTPRLGTNATRAVVWSWNGRAFGNTAPTGTVTVNHRYPGMYADVESGLTYNWNRHYNVDLGRYLSSDPIGVIPGVGNSPNVPRYITNHMRSVPLNIRLQRGLNHSYAYVENNPLKFIDPMGLYGTTSCSGYQTLCEQVGGVYYCYLAPAVCNNTPPGPWANCVRQCLQEYLKYCEPKNCGGGSDTICVVNIHQMCWQECIGGGSPRPEAGPPEHQ